MGEATMTDDQSNDDPTSGAIRIRRPRRNVARSKKAERPGRTNALSAIRRLLREPARPASSRDVSEREAEEELREATSPALEKLAGAMPGVSSPEEAADVVAPHPGSSESKGGENSDGQGIGAGDMVEAAGQYPVRDHVGGSAAPTGDQAADSTGYISAFAERMRDRSNQDPR